MVHQKKPEIELDLTWILSFKKRIIIATMLEIKKIKLFFFGFLLLSTNLIAQESRNQKISVPNHNISVAIMGSIPIGLAFDYTFSNHFNLEVALGAGYSAGLKYIITNPSKQRWNVFTGAFYTTTEFETITDSVGNTSQSFGINGNSLYVPLGISYLTKKKFQFSLEGGAMLAKGNLSPTVGLKIGHRFSVDYKVIKDSKKTLKKNILSGSLFGMTPLIGIVYERLLSPYLGVDIGIGLPSAGMGFKFYIPQIRDNKWSLHVGASQHYFILLDATGWKTYFPIGLSHLKNNGFRISFDLGPQINWYENIGSNYNLFFNGNLRIGKAF